MPDATFILARDHRHEDVSGWLLSEKLDGVRAMWTGSQFVGRGGMTIHAPAWFTVGLPDAVLDGELWLGRGRFDRCNGICRQRSGNEEGWADMRFMAFDAPGAGGGFAARLAVASDLVRSCRFAAQVEHVVVADHRDAMRHYRRIIRGGGEGVILRRPDAPYTPGRSRDYLRIKPQDATTPSGASRYRSDGARCATAHYIVGAS